MPKDQSLPLVSRRSVLSAAGVLASPAVLRAQGQAVGVALVIGNSKYQWEDSLPNVRRDAPDVAKRFQALGFKTELVQNAGQDAMRTALDKFTSAARGANLAAFYFAGHGASWDNDTYLVPSDADLGDPSIVQSLMPVRSLSNATKEAQHRLLVFDNCRNNPADGWRQRAAAGASRISKIELAATALQGANTLVLFSTAPGHVAIDGPPGENSPFAAVFLRQLAGPSVDLRVLPEKLRRELLIATEGRQVVWDQSTYDQQFLLTNSPSRSAVGDRDKVAADPAPSRASPRIVELPKAYAFAREKGLLLPPGLVALRAPNGSPDSQKIGSFNTTMKVVMGTSKAALTVEPLLLVVLSVTNATAAEVIFSTRNWGGGGGGIGKIWRYATATLSGSTLEFSVLGGEQIPEEFKWSDANSGTFASRGLNIWTQHNASFTRLD